MPGTILRRLPGSTLLGRDRVQLTEAPEQLHETAGPISQLLELGGFAGETARDLEPVHDGPVIKTGASDEERQVPTSVDPESTRRALA